MKRGKTYWYPSLTVIVLLLLLSPLPPAIQAAGTQETSILENFNHYNSLDTLHGSVWDVWQHQLTLAKINEGYFFNPLPLLLPSGEGFVVWRDGRKASDDLFAQKVDVRGNRLWQHDVLINEDFFTYNRFPTDLIPAQDGGLFVFFSDDRGGTFNCYAQRLSASGSRLWQQDIKINPGQKRSQCMLSAVMTPQGDIAVGWTADREYAEGLEDNLVFVQKITQNGQLVWSSPLQVNIVTGLTKVERSIGLSADPAGNLLVSWFALTPEQKILAQRIDLAGHLTWPAPVEVAPIQPPDSFRGMRASVRTDGSAFITWTDLQSGASATEIYGQRLSTDGQKLWTAPKRISNGSGNNFQLGFDTILDENGNLLVWWSGRRQDSPNIFWQKVLPDGNLWFPDDQPVVPNVSYSSVLPMQGSFNAAGARMVAYDYPGYLTVQLLSSGGTFLNSTPLIVHDLSGETNPNSVRTAAGPTGDTWALWQDTRLGHDKARLFIQRFDPGGQRQFAIEPQLDEGNRIDWYTDSNGLIAADPQGNALVAWEFWVGDHREIHVQKLGPAGQFQWPSFQRVSAPSTVDQKLYAVDVDANGRLYVLWGKQNIVYAQKLDVDGSRLWGDGAAVRATPPPAGWTFTPLGAVLDIGPDGTLNVAWWEQHDWHDDYGFLLITVILAQRLNASGQPLWPADTQVNVTDLGDSFIENVQIGADPSGNSYVIWPWMGKSLLQKLSASGVRQYAVDQIIDPQGSHGLTSASFGMDRTGVFYTAWSKNTAGMYVQRMDGHGSFLWPADVQINGQPVPPGWGFGGESISAGAVSASVGWETSSSTTGNNIFYNRVSSSGNRLWATDQPAIALNRFYFPAGFAQSKQVNPAGAAIQSARLDADFSTNDGSVKFYLSNNGGETWEAVTPGALHAFAQAGEDLRWRVELAPSVDLHQSPVIRSLTITYTLEGSAGGKSIYLPLIRK